MWKSLSKPHGRWILTVEKNVDSFIVFHRTESDFSFHICVSTFPLPIVENQFLSLELILDVMSRTTMMVLWSSFKRFSTLRMELRTVA